MAITIRTTLCLALVAALAATVTAQDPSNRNQRDDAAGQSRQQQAQQLQSQQSQQTQQGSQNKLTEILAGKLMLANHCEIQISEMALQMSQHPEVKEFAQMLIRDHNQANEQLARIAPQELIQKLQQTSTTRSTQTQQGERDATQRTQQDLQQRDQQRDQRSDQLRDQQRGQQSDQQADRSATQLRETQRQTTTAAGRQGQQGDDVLKQLCDIEVQAVQNALQANKQLLDQYQGQDFDMGFIGMQIVAHNNMLAHLKAMENVGSSELQQVVQKSLQTSQQHLAKARELSQRLEDDREVAGTRREQQPTRQR